MLFEEKIQENILLSPYTTLGIGGLAHYFVNASDEQTIFGAVAWAKKQEIPLFILGGGSNLVIADSGFPGLVLQINNQGIESHYQDGKVLVTVAAGETWDDFVALSVKNNWQGLECLSGIPGKLGATPIQNVGAYGQEVKDTIIKLQAYDRQLEKVVSFSNPECQFSYRQSYFKSVAKDRYIIFKVTYALTPETAPIIRYPELQKYLLENISSIPTLSDVRSAILQLRRSKAMVVDPLEPNSKSVGSFFMNPIVEEKKLLLIKEKLILGNLNDSIPEFPADTGRIKLSAAWLIEKAGFSKGYKKGNVAISSKHALALINQQNGTAKEICFLAEEIQEKVKNKFDIYLEPEPIYVGFNK
jgi:UDP-N-acetylmuramate dehydrogenase